MDEGRLPGVESATDRDDRIVLHVDMDCFYASCERLREPALRGEPVVVGMGYEAGEPHGAVATASYEAREHGVESAQSIGQALEALPRVETIEDGSQPAGHYRPVDMDFYKEVASDVKSVLYDCADILREVSIDEAYLDVTDRTAWEPAGEGDRPLAAGYAKYVKDRIYREVGVPASVGVAPDMSTAKIASDFEKPDGLTVVPPGSVRSFLDPIPIEEIHGIGPVTASKLDAMGIETAGDIARTARSTLVDRFGSRGGELYARARGEDDRAVTPTGRPKSLSRESAFADPTADVETLREKVRTLSADVAARAQSRGALYRTIAIKVVKPPFDVNTRASSLSGPVDDPALVESVALDLLSEFEGDRVRKVGVRVSKLDFDGSDQATLAGFEAGPDPGDRPARSESGAADNSEVTLADWELGGADSTPIGRPHRRGQLSLSAFETDDGSDETAVDDTDRLPRGDGDRDDDSTAECAGSTDRSIDWFGG
ncbi:MAG: DNA polymerase IV [Halobacteriota archaeon]